jgi:hypothetical protein
MSKDKKNHAYQFAAILFVAILINLFFYSLPDTIFGIQIKKVDLLSDIRTPSQNENHLTTLLPDNMTIINSDSTSVVMVPPPPLPSDVLKNQDEHHLRTNNPGDTISKPFNNDHYDTDNTQIEDFTADHTGLHRFFSALNNIDELGRPVRIAFVGDSFIEGDILVADFRAKMQERFGGRGVGFVPISSVTEQYRPTIKQSSDGWKAYSIIKDRKRKFVISGVQFEPTANNSSIRFQTVDM